MVHFPAPEAEQTEVFEVLLLQKVFVYVVFQHCFQGESAHLDLLFHYFVLNSVLNVSEIIYPENHVGAVIS